jgi:predicted outer membrane lipoprotein
MEKARVNPDNPAYIQLKLQLESINGEIEATQQREAETQRRYDEYQQRVARAPGVEQEYYALARDLDNTQAKYQEVRLKQREAESSQNLETERKGERFTLIEPPLPPEDPVSPNRPVVFLLGLLLSVALALGAAFTLESMDARVRRAADIVSIVGVAPLAILPVVETSAEIEARMQAAAPKRKRIVYVLVALAVALLLFVQLFVRPLDILFANAIRRLGF